MQLVFELMIFASLNFFLVSLGLKCISFYAICLNAIEMTLQNTFLKKAIVGVKMKQLLL